MILRQKLAKALEQAATQAQQRGLLAFTTLPGVTVEHPQNLEYGDYASSLPLKLARATKMDPMIIAERIIELMSPLPRLPKQLLPLQVLLTLLSAPTG